jgi:hypothetical protein
MAGCPEDDPSFKLAKKILEQHFDDKEFITEHGVPPAVQFNSEAMMKYYFVEKGLKYRIPAFKFELEEWGHSIADDRWMWKDPEMVTVPLEISVKDRSTLKIDSVSPNLSHKILLCYLCEVFYI